MKGSRNCSASIPKGSSQCGKRQSIRAKAVPGISVLEQKSLPFDESLFTAYQGSCGSMSKSLRPGSIKNFRTGKGEPYMCLAIPMEITSIEDNVAQVEIGGVKNQVRLDIID
ncbi:MAG: HypC/HybG/HupF family hydrogenase formation chaperone, partial [Desulfovibrionales bacterium]